MGPLQATVLPCLRHNYAVVKIKVLTIFIPTVAVYQACLWAMNEGLEYTLVLLLMVSHTPTLHDTCSAHRQVQLDIHTLKRLFGQRLRALTSDGIEVIT